MVVAKPRETPEPGNSRGDGVASGDAEARPAEAGIAAAEFDAIVRQHQRRICRLLLALVRDADAAETLTQECFLRAYQRRASFRGEASVGTWLVRIAINLAADHGKNRRRAFWSRLFSNATQDQSEAAEKLAARQALPDRALEAREEVEAVWAAVEKLPGQQRAAFVLRFAEEMTLEEIATALDVAVGTVKSHLARAVGAVRQRLEERKCKGT